MTAAIPRVIMVKESRTMESATISSPVARLTRGNSASTLHTASWIPRVLLQCCMIS